jgi:hypothetical protein
MTADLQPNFQRLILGMSYRILATCVFALRSFRVPSFRVYVAVFIGDEVVILDRFREGMGLAEEFGLMDGRS